MRTFPAAAAALLGFGLASASAWAATTVVGGGLAQSCYEAALFESTSRTALDACNRAFTEPLSAKDRVATHVNRGILRMHMHDVAGAIADFDRATALDPTEAEAYLNKAMALMAREDGWREALPLFDAAIANDTRKPELAYYGRGVAHEESGDIKAAYMDYKRAAELAPKWDDPMRELARFQVVKRGS